MLALEPQDEAVLRAVTRAAAESLPCPTNDVLCDLIGAVSVSTPARCMKRLERKGLIEVARSNSFRVVTVLSSGDRTAGEITNQHWRDRGPSVTRRQRPYKKRFGINYDAKADLPESFEPVDRDPCFYCGTRADVGCRHRK